MLSWTCHRLLGFALRNLKREKHTWQEVKGSRASIKGSNNGQSVPGTRRPDSRNRDVSKSQDGLYYSKHSNDWDVKGKKVVKNTEMISDWLLAHPMRTECTPELHVSVTERADCHHWGLAVINPGCGEQALVLRDVIKHRKRIQGVASCLATRPPHNLKSLSSVGRHLSGSCSHVSRGQKTLSSISRYY